MEPKSDRSALLNRLANIVATDSSLLKDGWTHLVLVSVIDSGTPDMTGFCYAAGKAVPVSPRDFSIFDVLEDLRRAMAAQDGGKPWVSALFRVDRASGKLVADFEYDNATRWSVTPQNVTERAKEFAPPIML